MHSFGVVTIRLSTKANEGNKGFAGLLFASLSLLPSVKSIRVHPPVLRSFSAKDGCNPWLKPFVYFGSFAVRIFRFLFSPPARDSSEFSSVKSICVYPRSSAVKIRVPCSFWRYVTYVLIVCLIGSEQSVSLAFWAPLPENRTRRLPA